MVNKEVLQQVYAYIDANEDNIIQELKDICSIKSISDANSDVKPFGQGCLDVLHLMLDKGKQHGFETYNYDNYVGGIVLNNQAEDMIGMWAHLDVVPEQDGWMSDPYQPIERDGFLFGRGVSDNKSAAIAGLYIQKAFRELQIPMKHNLQLFLGTSEETGMGDVEHYVNHYPHPKFSFVPDAGFPGACGEFGRVRYHVISKKKLSNQVKELHAGNVFNVIPNYAYVVLEDNGLLDTLNIPTEGYTVTKEDNCIKIEAFGLSRHAAAPEDAINAIHQLTKVLAVLPGLSKEDQEIFAFLTKVNDDSYGTFFEIDKIDEVSGQTVSSGTVLRMNDGIVTLTNDCRHCVTDTNERVIDTVTRVCEQHDFTMEVIEASKPYYLDKNSLPVQTITKAYQEYTKNPEAEMFVMKGGTYAGQIPNAVATGVCMKGTQPIPDYIKLGHGSVHQPDEMLPIDGYIEGIKLLATMILKVDEVL